MAKRPKDMPKWERPDVRKTITLPTMPNLDANGPCTGETIVLCEGSATGKLIAGENEGRAA